MSSDPDKPLLRLIPQRQQDRPVGQRRNIPRPSPFGRDRQTDTFSPKFNRLAEVLNRDPSGLELRADATALAPERLLVFDVRGSIAAFSAAIQAVPGLELIDEEELEADETDGAPVAYLMVPDIRALRNLESLWQRWLRGELIRGETPWRNVFETLRDLRPWGPADRVQSIDTNILANEIAGRPDDDLIKLEVELVFRANDHAAEQRENEVRAAILERGGRIVSQSRISDIAYHALLAEMPVRFVREIVERFADGVAGLEPVMYIRPQSAATTVDLGDPEVSGPGVEVGELADPIVGLLDGVPVAAHVLLAKHMVVDDQFGLEPRTPVADRVHGTAMASLIVHGDRNRGERPLGRRVHAIPVLGAGDAFPNDQLVIDIIYRAVMAMRGGAQPTAPGVLIVNLSLGNRHRPFHGQLSPWARLLDRLAYRFGILFLVSAGNCLDAFGVPEFATRLAFEDASGQDRSNSVLSAIRNVVAERRLLAPAETVNGLTIGACNDDAVSQAERITARVNVDPYPNFRISNPSSSLGPGFTLSVKPDILMSGAREHLRVVQNHTHIEVEPARASRSAGLKVAAPPRDGRENRDGYTSGTSAATALASRLCHRIHDGLEAAYGDVFRGLSHIERAVLLKALIVHPAKWPEESAALIRAVVGPPGGKFHARQKDNIRRFLGYGIVDGDEAVACTGDRATFWATGMLPPEKTAPVSVPVPAVMGGKARPHALSATLAWFTPVSPGRKSYRSVRLKLIEPQELGTLRLKAHGNQPDTKQTNRGTVFTRSWIGDKAPAVRADMSIELIVQRDPDQGATIDEAIPFGLAVTLAMPGVIEIYEQARQRLVVRGRAPVR